MNIGEWLGRRVRLFDTDPDTFDPLGLPDEPADAQIIAGPWATTTPGHGGEANDPVARATGDRSLRASVRPRSAETNAAATSAR